MSQLLNTNIGGDGTKTPSRLHPNGRPILDEKNFRRPIRMDAPVMEQVFPDTVHGKLLNGLLTCFLIKQEPRMGWARKSACDESKLLEHPCETVAAHQWGTAWIILTLSKTEEFKKELPDFDLAAAFQMALSHDLGELVIGDITPVDDIKADEKHKLESDAVLMISRKHPVETMLALQKIYNTYEERKCSESKFVKDCDRLDFMITAFMLERQGFTGFEEFYDNSKKEEFSLQLSRDLAELLTETRMSLADKGLLYKKQ